LILLATTLYKKEKRKTLISSFTFIAAIYISYFLFGTGLLSFLALTPFINFLYKGIGLFAILIGIFNLYNGITPHSKSILKIPSKWFEKTKAVLEKATSPLGTFCIGFLVSLIELPCTGGPYIVILGLLAKNGLTSSTIFALMLYNFIFILPLIIISFIIYLGKATIEKTNDWKVKYAKTMRLFGGLVMLIIGLMILSNLF